MVKKFLSKGKKILTSAQSSVLSAATIIMTMMVASRVLGLVRQRTLAHFFEPRELSLFFAAFRLPDLLFEVLVFGTFSSAFIPVFTRLLKRGKEEAWNTAATVVNTGLFIFVLFSALLVVGADKVYSLIAPGYSVSQRENIVQLTRILFAAQGFFVVSYVLTGVLESLRRFLVPALAPLFYNLGIILGTIFLSSKIGLLAPTVGVVVGAFLHFIIQLPLAVRMGFRFKLRIQIDKNVKRIGKLAAPRLVEVSFLQLARSAELFFSSLISTASYTYFMFANSLQALPVGLFGTSIAKAALPTLSRQASKIEKFRKTLFSALYDMTFFMLPFATILIVLRIPIVRLAYGTDIFAWEATVKTGYVLSAFALGVFFQAANSLLARAFYALHDTRTPVVVSVGAILLTIILDFVFIQQLSFDVWGLALAFSLGAFFQATLLFYLINKKFGVDSFFKMLAPMAKSAVAAAGSGVIMYLILKIFDRSVWVKRLSFITHFARLKAIPFESFVLDTRYTINLLVLTALVSTIGAGVYIWLSIVLKSEQVWTFLNIAKRVFIRRKVSPIPEKEQEPVSPPTTETGGV